MVFFIVARILWNKFFFTPENRTWIAKNFAIGSPCTVFYFVFSSLNFFLWIYFGEIKIWSVPNCNNIKKQEGLFSFLSVSDALPSEPPPQGLKSEIIIAIGVVGGVVFILIILAVVCGVFFHLQRKQIKEYRSQFFPYIDKQLKVMCNFPSSKGEKKLENVLCHFAPRYVTRVTSRHVTSMMW